MQIDTAWLGIFFTIIGLMMNLGALLFAAGQLRQRIATNEEKLGRLADVPERLKGLEVQLDGVSTGVSDLKTDMASVIRGLNTRISHVELKAAADGSRGGD